MVKGVGEEVCSCNKGGDEIGGVLNPVTSGVDFECLAIGDAVGDGGGGDGTLEITRLELVPVFLSLVRRVDVD